MEENQIFDKLPAKFFGMVEEYRLELAKRNPILDLDVNLSGITICGIHETVLISKKFGFIKWLVDNDKIDLEKLLKGIKENKIYCGKWGKVRNMLLMLLAIQDNPIEFLVSILK